ncbi:MAG: prepilin-type N-terminal cleavage/methylation domain-containing protein [Planctomycetes bacterium]|nr:prepilin-type N-terminal cleavage/methylation domain-containing protein [Planctomycetota bacterium]
MADRRQRRRGDAGLSLVEVIVAVAVLATLLLGVFSAMSHAVQTDTAAREMDAASRAIFSEIELLMARPDFDQVTGPSGFAVQYPTGRTDASGAPIVATLSPSPTNPHPDIASTTAINEAILPGRIDVVSINANLKEIQVVVRWRAANNQDQTLSSVARRVR